MTLTLSPPVTDHQPSGLDLSVPSGVDNVLRASGSAGSSNVLALEARQHAGVGAGQGTRGTVRVHLAVVAEVSLAGSVVGGGSEDLAWKASLGSLNNVLEDVTLSDNLGAGIGLESVLGVCVEVVVDGMEEGVAGDLGGAAGGVVDVVALHGDEIVGSGEIDSPVVVSIGTKSVHVSPGFVKTFVPIASRRPRGRTVDFTVGNGDTVGGGVTKNNVLTGNEIGGNVVNPDQVGYE
jgi:hypothetical protein